MVSLVGGEVGRWLDQFPPVCKWLGLASALGPLIVRFGPFSWTSHLLFKPALWKSGHLWRLYTPFFLAALSVQFLMTLLMRCRYAYFLEQQIGSARLAWLLTLGMSIMSLANAILYVTLNEGRAVMFSALNMCLIQVWSASNPDVPVSFWGGFGFPGRFLPLALLLWDGLLKGEWVEGVLGILTGHALWLAMLQKDLLRTPKWLIKVIEGRRNNLTKKYLRMEDIPRTAAPSTSETGKASSSELFSGRSYKLSN